MLKGSTAPSTSSFRAAAKASSRACRTKRACRCWPISKAFATSISMQPPISPRRAPSSLNAKMRRTGVCGAAETMLIDRAILKSHGMPILEDLAKAACEIRGDEAVRAVFPPASAATEEDWRTEYLDAIISVSAVDGVDEAIRHIETYGSHHTEAIVTEDTQAAEHFLGRSIPRSCCGTPRPNSPTAASSAWARKSASARASCMRAGRSASSSSRHSNMSCAARGRCGHDARKPLAETAGPGGSEACASACSAARSIRRMKAICTSARWR